MGRTTRLYWPICEGFLAPARRVLRERAVTPSRIVSHQRLMSLGGVGVTGLYLIVVVGVELTGVGSFVETCWLDVALG